MVLLPLQKINMKSKRDYIKQFLLLVTLISCSALHAQAPSKWMPDHAKLQFAGGIGFFSIGAGYASRKKNVEGDVYYGYVPKSIGGVEIHALTGKLTWFPLDPFVSGKMEWKPLSAGVLVNYTFGQQYFGFTPEKYPYDYYGHPTSIHAGIFLGGQLNRSFKSNAIRKIGVYYELGTFDVELISYVNNRNSLRIGDILNLALGLKASF